MNYDIEKLSEEEQRLLNKYLESGRVDDWDVWNEAYLKLRAAKAIEKAKHDEK